MDILIERLVKTTSVSNGALDVIIHNARSMPASERYAMFADRRTVLGNPWVIGNILTSDIRDRRGRVLFETGTQLDRDMVCGLYEMWTESRVYCPKGHPFVTEEREQLLHLFKSALRSRGKLDLNCWCAPKKCHTEVIARLLLHRLAI